MTKRTNQWAPWTKEEDELLKSVWFNRGSLKRSLPLFPGRTIHALRFRGSINLGLASRQGLKEERYSWVRDEVDRILVDGARFTVNEIKAQTVGSGNRIRQTLNEGRGKRYRVVDWVKAKNGGDWAPVWAAIPAVGIMESVETADVERPQRKSGAVASKQFRQRLALKAGRFDPFAGLINQVTYEEAA